MSIDADNRTRDRRSPRDAERTGPGDGPSVSRDRYDRLSRQLSVLDKRSGTHTLGVIRLTGPRGPDIVCQRTRNGSQHERPPTLQVVGNRRENHCARG